jgi:hypothetical protein
MVGFDQPILLQHYDKLETDHSTGKHVKRRLRFHRLSVEGINGDLTSQLDLTKAKRLPENAGISFFGATVIGRFDVDAAIADAWTPAERRAAVPEARIEQEMALVITSTKCSLPMGTHRAIVPARTFCHTSSRRAGV